MSLICNPCGQKLGKHKGVSSWGAGVCSVCGEKQYVTEKIDFGITEKNDELDILKFFKGF